MRARLAVYMLLGCLASTGVACGKDATSPTRACTASLQTVTAEVATGTLPKFSWTPNCGVHTLTVRLRQFLPEHDAWSVRDPSAHIAGPVTYGETPSTATVITAPEPLARGYLYRIYLFDGNSIQLGSSDFRP